MALPRKPFSPFIDHCTLVPPSNGRSVKVAWLRVGNGLRSSRSIFTDLAGMASTISIRPWPTSRLPAQE
jgi:hypothetical protein